MELTLKLSEPEINMVLGVLAEKPYGMVFGVVHKIQQQANKQIEEQQAEQIIKENHDAAKQTEAV